MNLKNGIILHLIGFFQILKTSIAVQTLSASVADSLKYLREILKVPEFIDSEPTEVYCRKFNQLFDILNSSNIATWGDGAPLTPKNIDEKARVLAEHWTFLEKLEIWNKKKTQKKFVYKGK